ncbi:MAG: AraC family transcriptional regulator [Ruminiclostridium sp.]
MESWESIQKTLEYIELNLCEKIEINYLSMISNLSPFYFQRLFGRLVGKPVMEYVKLRRIAKASELIMNKNSKIIDVGMSVGFENHETFTRAFKNYYGLTPETFRKEPRPLTHFFKPDLSMLYRLIEEDIPLVAEGIVLEVSRRILTKPRCFSGLSIDTPFPNKPGIDYLAELWSSLHSIKSKLSNLKQGGNEVGVGTPSEKEGHIKYFAGIEVTCQETSGDYCSWTMVEGNYVICLFEAENFYLLTTNALDKAVQYMYNTWLPKNKILTEPFLAELYFNNCQAAYYMEIWFKTVREDV